MVVKTKTSSSLLKWIVIAAVAFIVWKCIKADSSKYHRGGKTKENFAPSEPSPEPGALLSKKSDCDGCKVKSNH